MRLLICPLLFVAALPAHARFCDPHPQSSDPGGGGQECTQTRVAHYDPLTKIVVSDYSQTAVSLDDSPVDFSLDLSALESTAPRVITLLELGIARGAAPGGTSGGHFALQADIGSETTDPLPKIHWVWMDGRPTASVTDPLFRETTETVITAPWVVHGEARVTISPVPDWCHPQIDMFDTFSSVSATYQVDLGDACATVSLRSGVMGANLDDGMSTWFEYHMYELIGH